MICENCPFFDLPALFCSTDHIGCQKQSLKSDRSAVKSPQLLTSSAVSATLPQIFSFHICKMSIIKITTSWVVVRIKYDNVCEALSSVSHTEQCYVLLELSSFSYHVVLLVFHLFPVCISAGPSYSQLLMRHCSRICLCLYYSFLGS